MQAGQATPPTFAEKKAKMAAVDAGRCLRVPCLQKPQVAEPKKGRREAPQEQKAGFSLEQPSPTQAPSHRVFQAAVVGSRVPGSSARRPRVPHGALKSRRGFQLILEEESVDIRTVPAVWDWDMVAVCLQNHRRYCSRTWRLSRQWMRKMRTPWKLLMMVNR